MNRRLAAVIVATIVLSSIPTFAPETVGATPTAEPGGVSYEYDEVMQTRFGEQPTGYHLIEPAGVPADAEPLPIVILLHGYTATDPRYLGAWIDHIVRQGQVVIFPDYQTDDPLGEPPQEYTGNMIDGVAAALDELGTGEHVPTTLAGLTVAGYSMGGVLALNYAAMAESLNLPSPSAVFAVTPGGCSGCGGPGGSDEFGVPYRDLARIEPDTKLLLVVGEDDDFVGARPAEIAWAETSQIPDENRDYLIARSDDHGQPAIVADHSFPSSDGLMAGVDALDTYGTHKWLDGLMACAADETACAETMNGGATQLDMGTWPDGTPALPATYVESP